MLKKRLRKDSASSEMVSLILLIPLIVGLLITIIDLSIFFNNKSQIDAVIRDGARTVAIVGGNGTATHGTALENRYGLSSDTCSRAISDIRKTDSSQAGFISADKNTPTECNIASALVTETKVTSVGFKSIKCTPSKTSSIGENVTCTVKYDWNGIPGSAFSAVKLSKDRESVGSAQSEVNLSGERLVVRG